MEHDAAEIWSTQAGVITEAVANGGIHIRDLAGIGITNQRETTVVWDRRTGEPICRAIVWQDRRTAEQCDHLKALGHAELIQKKTGLVLDAYFSATKLKWIFDHVDGARKRADAGELAFGTVDSWLAWKLTGGAVHITDASNASRTLLYNIHTRQWDAELLELFGVPEKLLPQVRPSSEVYAETAGRTFSAQGRLWREWPGTSRQRFSAKCASGPACVKHTYGTGGFMMLNTGRHRHRLGESFIDNHCLAIQRKGYLCAGRQHFHRGRGRAMVAGRIGLDQDIGGHRKPGRHGCGQRGRLSGAGFRRSWARRIGTNMRAARSRA